MARQVELQKFKSGKNMVALSNHAGRIDWLVAAGMASGKRPCCNLLCSCMTAIVLMGSELSH